ncbi:Peroxiredoxin [Arachidicoccus rhizosphaerae]|uniref:Peroxiredoxin n=1 Tax=Arachidicoccus rhizosphaerae TaxID=551991 RepID=A0A1H3XZT0_9BACT|nr:redoxin domain-containing protein [Arachidicoccus rhizosphaerae]SEA04866.1 Peroxiredoxin [Arachidicoccus rhizosphaerae]
MSQSTAKVNKHVLPFTEVLEGAPSISNYYGFSPLKKGDLLPVITHPGSHIIYPGVKPEQQTVKDITPVSLLELSHINKPLVIAFRPSIQHTPKDDIHFLDSFQRDIQIMGGSLLVVSNANIRYLRRQLGQHNHLWVLSDPHNSLAEQFGLYTPENPIGDWLSGIDDNIPLPAFYVVLPSGEISYHYVDYNFRTYSPESGEIYQQGFVRQILTRIYQDAHYLRHGQKAVFKHP